MTQEVTPQQTEAAALEAPTQADVIRQKLKEAWQRGYDLSIKKTKIEVCHMIAEELKADYPHLEDKVLYASVSQYVPKVLAELTNKPPPEAQVKRTAGSAKTEVKVKKQGNQQAQSQPQTETLDPATASMLSAAQRLETEAIQTMKSEAFGMAYLQYYSAFFMVREVIKATGLPVSKLKQYEDLSKQWAILHTKHGWQFPTWLETLMLTAGTGGVIGLPIAIKLGVIEGLIKKKKKDQPKQSGTPLSDRNKTEAAASKEGDQGAKQ